MRKTLYIVRGLPGSGKTSLARQLTSIVHSADDFFYELGEGSYAFDSKLLGKAHLQCQERVEAALEAGEPTVAVANTFSQAWEAEHYFKLAEYFGYSVFVVECQSSFGNVHDVPPDAIKKMAARWEPLG